MSIYISHLYVELDINVGVASFDVIYMIFNEKSVIGKSVDFSLDFCIYIGIKWLRLWVEIWCVRLVEALVLVEFDDIVCDMVILISKLVKCLILLGFM